MMTSGERRGLTVLTIILALIVVFVLCRKQLLSPGAGADGTEVELADTVSVYPDSLSAQGDSVSRGSDGMKKGRRGAAKKVKPKRVHATRDPLSQPVN